MKEAVRGSAREACRGGPIPSETRLAGTGKDRLGAADLLAIARRFRLDGPRLRQLHPHPHAVRDRPKVNDTHGEGDVRAVETGDQRARLPNIAV